MERHNDGRVTLTKVEFGELKRAYKGLYQVLNSMPSSLSDFFATRSAYLNAVKWHEQLLGRE
jgi:hypothetical protein